VSTVLLVDDDAIVRKILGAVLEQAGFTVLSAANGRSGMQVANAFEGDIEVLASDLQMPDMSGVELASLLTQSRPNLKVLLLSSANAPKDLREGWTFLRKPFPPEMLVEKLREFTEHGATGARS
jgi:CheY-like chemotaxis protein